MKCWKIENEEANVSFKKIVQKQIKDKAENVKKEVV